MPTPLRHDEDYLRRLLGLAVNMHRPLSIKVATMLADVRDYLMYLTLDGLDDPHLAETLIDRFSALQAASGTGHEHGPHIGVPCSSGLSPRRPPTRPS